MAKNVPFRVIWNFQELCYQINTQTPQGLTSTTVDDENTGWEHWLSQVSSFAFHGRNGEHFTARKERRQRGGEYWTAYRKVNGKLRRKYLGTSADLALHLLENVANDLAPPQTSLVNGSSHICIVNHLG